MIDKRKMSKQPPPAPIASAVGSCPAIIQICRIPWHRKFSQHHPTTPNFPMNCQPKKKRTTNKCDLCCNLFSAPVRAVWPRGYKKKFHTRLSNAQKYEKYQEILLFSGSDKLRMLFFLLRNVKMPTVVGILTFLSRKNFMLS